MLRTHAATTSPHVQVLRSSLLSPPLEELQASYRAARALLLDQLQHQKQAAEQQRSQVLLQLRGALSSGRWR